MDLRNIRFAFVICESDYDPDKGYQVGLVKENVNGYFMTDMYWGHDFKAAQDMADKRNIGLCGSIEKADEVIMSSMRKRQHA